MTLFIVLWAVAMALLLVAGYLADADQEGLAVIVAGAGVLTFGAGVQGLMS